MATRTKLMRIDEDLANEMKKASERTGRSQRAISKEISLLIKGKKPKIEWRFKV
jgi:hypothetical protein